MNKGKISRKGVNSINSNSTLINENTLTINLYHLGFSKYLTSLLSTFINLAGRGAAFICATDSSSMNESSSIREKNFRHIMPNSVLDIMQITQTWSVMGESFELESKYKVIDYLGNLNRIFFQIVIYVFQLIILSYHDQV
jgi:hypothetical protein